MKNICLIILSGILTSCVNDTPKFQIKNESNLQIDSVIVGFSKKNPTKLYNLDVNKSYKGKIIFTKNITNDGNYFIEVYINGKPKIIKSFGYYTNGKPLNNSFDITIRKDSILVE